MQACDQAETFIVRDSICNPQAFFNLIQFHQAGDTPLQTNNLLHGREIYEATKNLKLLKSITVPFLLNQSLGEVLP